MQYLVRLSSFFCSSMIKESALADHISQLVWVIQCSRSVQLTWNIVRKKWKTEAFKLLGSVSHFTALVPRYRGCNSLKICHFSFNDRVDCFSVYIQEWIMIRLIMPPLPIPESAYLITGLTPPPPISIPICFPCRYLHKNQLTSLHYRHFHSLDQLTYL